jgi:hypothetical protein
MLLIAEIVLTVIAWRKGWRSRALLPLGIAGGVGFILGILIGVTHAAPVYRLAGLPLDVGAVIALVIMSSHPRASATSTADVVPVGAMREAA